MSHKKRIALFYLFVAAFLLGGTGVLLYSYGWRINFEEKTIQKIGAIYIKTNVRGTTIIINGKVYKDTAGILQSGTLISNLLPKTYRVEIIKDGYHPYHKTLVVQPSQVTEILNAQLIPKNLKTAFVAPTKGTRFIDATQGAGRMILQNTETGIFYLYDKANASSTLNLSLAVTNAQKGLKIRKIMFVPFKPTQFIVEDTAGLRLFDIEKKTIEPLLKGPIITWIMQDSTIVGVEMDTKTRAHKAFVFNLVFKSKTAITDLNTGIATSTRITAIAATGSGSMAFSDTTYGLFLFDHKTKTIRRVADNIESFAFSPDAKKLAFIEATGIMSVLFVEDFDGDMRKKAGEVIVVALPQERPVQTMHWYADSYHLFIERSDGLSITELDNRSPLNTFPIINEYNGYRYIPENAAIYITDAKGIGILRLEQ